VSRRPAKLALRSSEAAEERTDARSGPFLDQVEVGIEGLPPRWLPQAGGMDDLAAAAPARRAV
jgi:hypothetical protein